MMPNIQPSPEPSVIWEEERHVFIKVGPDAYQHYIRPLTGRPRMLGVEKLIEQRMYTYAEAQIWCAAHNPPPISEAEVYAIKSYPGSEEEMLGDSHKE